MLYAVKKLIQGYQLGVEFAGKTLVAIPDKFYGKKIEVVFEDKKMIIEKVGEGSLTFRTFEDKFGRGTNYTLVYHQWKPMTEDEMAKHNYYQSQGL